ncbi:hypothetical protein DQ04_01691000 [Trypanosoma grayi]|uniref:hypothetical protein n=1 Tax=Trypanosoma grayi TaxID=71804 RepID=UPI0004F4532D|nr:hypothetical protein DQ04_01691000 [Trypanosoma grayi]KEG12462.1 hypothetical protein DQ04_01691000 [Trypanosoma grayi]
MDSSGVDEVDRLAEQMYASPDPLVRQQAQASLDVISKGDTDSALFYAILQKSSNQYTLLFIAQSIVLWFKSTRKWLSDEQKRDLIVVHCGGCLKRVYDNGAPKHVLMSLLTAYAKLTKLAFETEPFLENAVDFPLELLLQQPEGSSLRLLSLMLLNTMVVEFSKYDSSKSQTYLTFVAHRHCSSNFKEKSLLNVFMAALKHLEVTTANSPHVAEVVKLVENCLCFDFRAIMVDETEELPFVQFPSTWKSTLLNEQNLHTLWGQHAALPYPHCADLLAGLTGICGVHRTFFDSAEERVQYLQYTLDVLTDVAMLQDGRLKIPRYIELLIEACRRILLSFGYRELRALASFERWVSALQMLSTGVLSVPFGQEGCFGTSTTVMSFWSALTTSKRRSFVDQTPRDIEDVAAQLLQSFLEARVRGSEAGSPCTLSLGDDEGGANLMEAVLSQSDAYATVCLLDPPTCLNNLATYLNQSVGMSILSSPLATGWLFYLAGSIVRLVLFNMEDNGVEPSSHVFAYVTGCATHRLRRDGDPAMFGSFVERGVLHFLTGVQLMLGGTRHSNLSAVIVNVFQNRVRLFQFALDNVGHNLLRGADDADAAEIIRASADLISDACHDAPPSLLRDLSFDLPPTAELPLARSEQTYKLRTNVMRALWFLRKTSPCTREMMESYLHNVEINMQQTVNSEVTNPSFVAGWLRDLRGACQALNEDEPVFGDFVDWFCARFRMFLMVLDVASDSPVVVNALMRFLCELVTPGRCGRLHVPSNSNSAVGLMLFKHICGLIAKVGEKSFSAERIAAHNGSSLDYDKTLKPWMLSMNILKRCVQGSFVPFGAMLYYNDDMFESTIVELIRNLSRVGPNAFKEHAKFAASALDLLRSLTEENLYFPLRHLTGDELLSLVGIVVMICEDVDTPSGTLLHGLSFLAFVAGLVREVKAIVFTPLQQADMSCSSGTPPPTPSTQGFYVTHLALPLHGGRPVTNSRPPRFTREVREQLAGLLAPHEDLWQLLIATAMNIIVFQDRAVSASSGVAYPIFEAHPPFWYAFVEQLVAAYPEQKQAGVREALSNLTNAAETREKFFSEVFVFRQALRRVGA